MMIEGKALSGSCSFSPHGESLVRRLHRPLGVIDVSDTPAYDETE